MLEIEGTAAKGTDAVQLVLLGAQQREGRRVRWTSRAQRRRGRCDQRRGMYTTKEHRQKKEPSVGERRSSSADGRGLG